MGNQQLTFGFIENKEVKPIKRVEDIKVNQRFNVNSLMHNGCDWIISADNKEFTISNREVYMDNILLENYICMNLFNSYVIIFFRFKTLML